MTDIPARRRKKNEVSAVDEKVVVVQSFGFKYGMPTLSDYVLDVRVLTNPFYVEKLKNLTGNDQKVVEYIMAQPQTAAFLEQMEGLIDCVVQEFSRKNRPQIVISVGCTGGRHRSVFAANRIVEHLQKLGYRAEATHRDINR